VSLESSETSQQFVLGSEASDNNQLRVSSNLVELATLAKTFKDCTGVAR
jgi:hypothetical protein